MFSRGIVVLLLVILIVSGFLFFWKLGSAPLENWDEGIHAEVSREMYQQGSWLSLSYRNEFYTAKPPLKFWLTTALFPIFGMAEFSIRFWSALAGVGTALLIALWAWEWTRRYATVLVATSTFLFSQLVFLHAFRTGETDGLFVFFATAALYCFWKSQKDRRWFLWFGVFVGIGIMCKSVAGLLPPLIVGLDLTISRRWRTLGFATILKAAGLALLIIAPWHLYETFRHGMTFWKSYIGFNVLDRATENLYANKVPWWWYADVLFRKTYPYKYLLPTAAILSFIRLFRSRDALDRLLLLTIGIIFVLFTAVQTKFAWYILPLFPPLALLVGRSTQQFFEEKHRFVDLLFFAAFFGSMVVLPTGIDPHRSLWKLLPHAYLPVWFSSSLLGRVAFAAAVSALLLLVVVWVRRVFFQPRLLLGGLVLAYLFFIAFGWQVAGIKYQPTQAPLKTIAAKLHNMPSGALDVYGVDLLRQPAGYFYLRRDANRSIQEVQSFSAVTAPYVLTTPEHEPEFVGRTASVSLRASPYLLLTLTK